MDNMKDNKEKREKAINDFCNEFNSLVNNNIVKHINDIKNVGLCDTNCTDNCSIFFGGTYFKFNLEAVVTHFDLYSTICFNYELEIDNPRLYYSNQLNKILKQYINDISEISDFNFLITFDEMRKFPEELETEYNGMMIINQKEFNEFHISMINRINLIPHHIYQQVFRLYKENEDYYVFNESPIDWNKSNNIFYQQFFIKSPQHKYLLKINQYEFNHEKSKYDLYTFLNDDFVNLKSGFIKSEYNLSFDDIKREVINNTYSPSFHKIVKDSIDFIKNWEQV